MHYHAHVYWRDYDQRGRALYIRSQLSELGCDLGRVMDAAIGPHPLPMYQANYSTAIAESVESLLKSTGLTVLLHEDTGDDIRDHTQGARWLGETLELDLVWLEQYTQSKEIS